MAKREFALGDIVKFKNQSGIIQIGKVLKVRHSGKTAHVKTQDAINKEFVLHINETELLPTDFPFQFKSSL